MKSKSKTPKKKPIEAKVAKKRGRPAKAKTKKPVAKIKVEKTKAVGPVKVLENVVVMEQRRERQYKFDGRLVPFNTGPNTKEGNLIIRDALIKLGQTNEMTELFEAISKTELSYSEEGKGIFIKALFSIINGFDNLGLANIYEDDVKAIYESNMKSFNDHWDSKDRIKNLGIDMGAEDFVN